MSPSNQGMGKDAPPEPKQKFDQNSKESIIFKKPDLFLPPILPSVLTWLVLVSATQRQELMAVLSLVPLLVAV